MYTHEMRKAFQEAETTFRAVDNMTADFAALIAGRLQSGQCIHSTLAKLKKELANYNIHTGRWKE